MYINFKKVNYTYNKNTPYEQTVLENIDLNIVDNSFTVIVGKTGSGKSTLIEHINGLLIPDSGYVELGKVIKIENKHNRKQRKNQELELQKERENIAMLFQFSEQQLFATTVLQDIIFAPLNYGVDENTAINRAQELIKLVGLSEEYLLKSPFELSGGEMRKVALCGVLALKPKVLVLDEPTIGLDFKSKKEFFSLINNIYKSENITIVLITHNMDYVLQYATNIVVLHKGKIALSTDDKKIFLDEIQHNNYNLSIPPIIELQNQLIKRGIDLDKYYYNYEELLNEITIRIGV